MAGNANFDVDLTRVVNAPRECSGFVPEFVFLFQLFFLRNWRAITTRKI
jgi:hypothetical protein